MHLRMRTAVVQATSLGTASNLLAQIISASRTTVSGQHHGLLLGWLDVPQLLRFVFFSFVTAPLNYHFQQLLEHAFPARRRRPSLVRYKRSDDPEQPDRDWEKPSTPSASLSCSPGGIDWPNTMIKWFLDSISLGTFVNTVAFLAIMGFLKGQSSSQIIYSIRTQLAPIVFAGYRVWPVASFISFTCVPLERRVGWNSLVGLFWGVYMSMIAETV